jgi:hypothetical protein
MTSGSPRVSSVKATFAILGTIGLTIAGCTLFSTEGRAFEVTRGGSWELFATACLISAGLLAFWLYSLALKSKPSFSFHDDRIEYYRWKQPIFFRDVTEVVLEPAQFLGRQHTILYLRLADNSIQHIPFGLMTHGPAEFADLINKAVEHYRATHSTAS